MALEVNTTHIPKIPMFLCPACLFVSIILSFYPYNDHSDGFGLNIALFVTMVHKLHFKVS